MTRTSNEAIHQPNIQVNPLVLTIHDGMMMLVTGRDGWAREGYHGLYDNDTRYLSTYQLLLNGFIPIFLNGNAVTYNTAILSYTSPEFSAGPVRVAEDEIYLQVFRVLDEGFHERIEVTSYAEKPLQFNLIVHLIASFDTLPQVRGTAPVAPRIIRTVRSDKRDLLTFSYRNQWFERQLVYRILAADSIPRLSPNALAFPIRLRHAQTWKAEVTATTTGSWLGRFSRSYVRTPSGTHDDCGNWTTLERLRHADDAIARWRSELATVESANAEVDLAYQSAVTNLASLRLEKIGDGWYPAAGVPWYNCLFGRDALVTSYQTLPLGCPFPRAVLTRLAQLQGTKVDNWNDEEPGKIPHQLRVSELSVMGKIPFHPFYGTVDASLLYIILLGEMYDFTGDRSLLEEFLAPMEGCLAWAATYGDRDHDGFIEYWRRGPQDYHNQAWKDASDAVVYPDGTQVPDPIAIVEVQGYYYAALGVAAKIYRVVGRSEDANRCARHAEDLKARFNQVYWLPDEGYYAFGLDPQKRPIRSIASNPGQLLWTRIVPPERAARVARRLFESDLFSGWGVRTLSTQNGAYDPLSYQRGSVWPVDNALIAQGLKRYGFWSETNQIAEGMFDASHYFANATLPELWAGLDRQTSTWPVLYPRANVPQAWSAGAIPLLLRSILGIEPDIAQRTLRVRPTLPSWLSELTVRNLHFAGKTLDLRFRGEGEGTEMTVLRSSSGIAVVQQSS